MSDTPTDPDCLFCNIVTGDIPARTVATNEHAQAFLDVNPLSPGHTLVIPTTHAKTLTDTPSAYQSAVFDLVSDLTPKIEAAVDADATTIGINNGPAAGQEVPHLHVHIVPRFDGDGGGPIHGVAGTPPDLSDDELDDIATRIAQAD